VHPGQVSVEHNDLVLAAGDPFENMVTVVDDVCGYGLATETYPHGFGQVWIVLR
jgi:hypothetical protein